MPTNQGFGDRVESEVKNLLDRIDNGNIFKSIIVLFFRLIGWGIIASGLWACIINMFSDDDLISIHATSVSICHYSVLEKRGGLSWCVSSFDIVGARAMVVRDMTAAPPRGILSGFC